MRKPEIIKEVGSESLQDMSETRRGGRPKHNSKGSKLGSFLGASKSRQSMSKITLPKIKGLEDQNDNN